MKVSESVQNKTIEILCRGISDLNMLKLVIFLAIALIPFVSSYNDDTMTLKQFTILKKLGNGAYAEVYLAKKIGGLDDSQLYALKAINVPHVVAREKVYKRNSINNEREILEIMRDPFCNFKSFPRAVGLHYAWREGKYLFLAMDFVPGGTISSRINENRNSTVAKLVIAELVVAVEQLHTLGVLHRDLKSQNILIDHDGHLTLADFGIAIRLPSAEATKEDWALLYKICQEFFTHIVPNEIERGITETFNTTLTDAQLPELKNHPYFSGINWKKVAEKKSDPPYEPIQFEIDEKCRPINLTWWFKIDVNEKLDETTLKRLQNYTFIAPEHQH